MSKVVSRLKKVYSLVFRNNIILCFINEPAKKNMINLHWMPIGKWSDTNDTAKVIKSEKQNFGDWLAVPIYEYMLKINNLDKNKHINGIKHLYTVGSIIMMGYQNATIWGSGILRFEPEGTQWKRNKYRKLDIRCVRGPETKRRLQENGYDVANCSFGDPGVLMPLIYKPTEYSVKKEYSVIIHMNKRKGSIENEIEMLTDDWKRTIDEIYNSKLIISSSLHGIIIAEAYGIPAILLDNVENNDYFKYNDYYYSTGRMNYPVCHSIEEALNMPIPSVPDLSKLQKNLLESFPVDLWNNN